MLKRELMVLVILIVFSISAVQVSAWHFSYSGTNYQTCLDACVTGHEQTLAQANLCPGICNGIISDNQGSSCDYVQCASLCTKVVRPGFCGCDCPGQGEIPSSPAPTQPVNVLGIEIELPEFAEVKQGESVTVTYTLLLVKGTVHINNKVMFSITQYPTNDISTSFWRDIAVPFLEPYEYTVDISTTCNTAPGDYLFTLNGIVHNQYSDQDAVSVKVTPAEGCPTITPKVEKSNSNDKSQNYNYNDEPDIDSQPEEDSIDDATYARFTKLLENNELVEKIVSCDSLKDPKSRKAVDNMKSAIAELDVGIIGASELVYTTNRKFIQVTIKNDKLVCFEYIETILDEIEKIKERTEEIKASTEKIRLSTERIKKETDRLNKNNEQIKSSDMYIKEVKCDGLKDSRVVEINNEVKKEYGVSGEDLLRVALDANDQLHAIQIVAGKQTCYDYVKIPYLKKGNVKYRSVVPVPDLTQEQIDFVNEETFEEQRRLKNPTLLETFSDDLQSSTVLYEDKFEWAPGLNVQVSSNPQDIVVWGAEVITGPIVKKVTGKITKMVLSDESMEQLSVALDIVSKNQAMYEIIESTPQEEQLTGDYSIGPITIGIIYEPELIRDGYNENNLGLFHGTLEAGKVVLSRVENIKIDTVNKMVLAKVECCSFFFVGILKEEPQFEGEESNTGVFITLFILFGVFVLIIVGVTKLIKKIIKHKK